MLKDTSYKKKNILAATVTAILAGGIGNSAGAQEQAGDAGLEEIMVTGSRIRQTSGMTSPVPVTTISTAELSNFEPVSTPAEQLSALPQFFGTMSAQRGSFPLSHQAGAGYLNLRNLGNQRTLVLLDGSRVVPGDKYGPVNIETFPTALIRSVDVVTGGASAAYGADALGGVVNFIIDREFQGLKISTGTGISEWGDGQRWNFSIAGGRQFGERLNVIASIEAKHINQIARDPEKLDPDWFQRWGFVTNPAWRPGAPAGVPRQLTLPNVTKIESPYGLIKGTGVKELDYMKFLPDGSGLTPFIFGDVVSLGGAGSTVSMSGGPESEIANRAYNSPVNGSEVAGRSGFLGLKYQLRDSVSLFGQLMIGRSESGLKNPRGLGNFPDPYYASIAVDNAFLPERVRQIMVANNLSEFKLYKSGSFLGVPDIAYQEEEKSVFTTVSWSVGFDAVLPNDWELRASWQSGESGKVAGEYPMIRVDRIYLGMDAVRHPVTGAIVCRVQLFNPTPEQLAASPAVRGRISSLSPNANASEFSNVAADSIPLKSPIGLDNTVRDCIPYNVMGNGNISKEALDYTATPKINHGELDQDFAELLLTGDVYEGWGYGPVSMAAGLTWREQTLDIRIEPRSVNELGPPLNDPALGIRGIPPGYTGGSPYLWAFSTAPTVSGEYDVWEWFSEANLPIWEAASGIQRLGGSVAYRSSDYSGSGRIASWKAGLDFDLFEELRLRATRSRDVREPTFSERFDAQGGGATITDPMFGNSNYVITTVTGGNPNLKPEIGNTTVLGFVYQPNWAEGLQLSTDWYRVDINDKVDILTAQRVLDECTAGSLLFCNDVRRQPDGTIGRIRVLYQNIAKARAEGVDVELAYRIEPDFFGDAVESFTLRALGGYLLERSDTPRGGTTRDIVGDLNTPKFTFNVTGDYAIGPYSFQLQGRHVDSVARDINWIEGIDIDDNSIPSYTWWNTRFAYNGETTAGAAWNVSLNVQNVFDRNPPIIASNAGRAGNDGGSQSVSDNYDVYGRRYALSFNYSF